MPENNVESAVTTDGYPGVEPDTVPIVAKTLDISDVKGATENISDLKVFGDGDTFHLLCKASSESEGWMKSTKVCNIAGKGALVQVSTQQRNHDGTYSVAEALAFVPGTKIDLDADPRELVPF